MNQTLLQVQHEDEPIIGSELTAYAKRHGLEQWKVTTNKGITYLALYLETEMNLCGLLVSGSLEKVAYCREEVIDFLREDGSTIEFILH